MKKRFIANAEHCWARWQEISLGSGVRLEFHRIRQFSWEWLMYRAISVELRACATEWDRSWTCSEWEYRFEKGACAPVTSKNAGKASGCKLLRDTILQAFACACTRVCDFGASCCAKIVLIFKCALFHERRREIPRRRMKFLELVASINFNRISKMWNSREQMRNSKKLTMFEFNLEQISSKQRYIWYIVDYSVPIDGLNFIREVWEWSKRETHDREFRWKFGINL